MRVFVDAGGALVMALSTAAQFLVRSMLPGLLLVLVLLGLVLVLLGLVLVLLGQGQKEDKVRRWRGLKVGGGSTMAVVDTER